MRDYLRLWWARAADFVQIARGKGHYDAQERNIALLYLEIAAASVLSSAANFNGAFALRLGASNTLIGLMSSIPALITMLGMVPASTIVERHPRRWTLMQQSLAICRLLFFPVALIPLVVPARFQAVALVGLLSFRLIPLLFFSAGFDSFLAEIIKPNLRAQVFSWRNIIATASTVLALLAIRPWLELAPFPENYIVVYLVGGLGGLVSSWLLSRLEVPPHPPLVGKEHSSRPTLAALRAAAQQNPQYVRFLVNTLVANAGSLLAGPLYIIYYVRLLHASDAWIASLTLIANLSTMLGYFLWKRWLPRFGESKVLKAMWPINGLLPLLIGLSGSLNLVLIIVFWYGLVSPGLNLSHYNTLLEVCPAARRPTYISVYSSLNNVLAFVLPMVAIGIANSVGLQTSLVIAGLMWIGGGMLFTIWPVKVPDVSRQMA
jgi:hypothetical protein